MLTRPDFLRPRPRAEVWGRGRGWDKRGRGQGQGRGQRSEAKAEYEAKIVYKNITFKKLLITCSLSICVIISLRSFTHSHSIIIIFNFKLAEQQANVCMNVCLRKKCHSACKPYTPELHFRNSNDSRVVFDILELFGLIIRPLCEKFAPQEPNLHVCTVVLRTVTSKRRHCLHDYYALQWLSLMVPRSQGYWCNPNTVEERLEAELRWLMILLASISFNWTQITQIIWIPNPNRYSKYA